MTQAISMTGFATLQSLIPDTGEGFTLTLKSVNHRHLDLQLRIPHALDVLEASLRKHLRQQIRRGHVEFTLTFDHRPESRPTPQITLDEPTLAAYLAAFRQASHLHRLTADPDLHELLRLPGVMTTTTATSTRNPTDTEAAVLASLDQLLATYQQSRQTEGQALAEELQAAMHRANVLADEATALRSQVTKAQFDRLRLRMTELLAETTIPEERILAEAALLAERGDVEEELVRLRTHIARFEHLLATTAELGKPLDFLLQELNREANTLLSKTGAAAGAAGHRITEIGLALKLEFERAREQVQNLE